MGKTRRDHPQGSAMPGKPITSRPREDANKEIDKEIIRRLRIQNKKLIEQVAKLKDEMHKMRTQRTQVLDRLNELIGII
jgi:hypothetical protein